MIIIIITECNYPETAKAPEPEVRELRRENDAKMKLSTDSDMLGNKKARHCSFIFRTLNCQTPM